MAWAATQYQPFECCCWICFCIWWWEGWEVHDPQQVGATFFSRILQQSQWRKWWWGGWFQMKSTKIETFCILYILQLLSWSYQQCIHWSRGRARVSRVTWAQGWWRPSRKIFCWTCCHWRCGSRCCWCRTFGCCCARCPGGRNCLQDDLQLTRCWQCCWFLCRTLQPFLNDFDRIVEVPGGGSDNIKEQEQQPPDKPAHASSLRFAAYKTILH